MTGLELVMALVALGLAVYAIPVAGGLAAPVCLGAGASAFVWGFVFGWWPLAIAGLVLLGAGTFLHERRVWARKYGASAALEEERSATDRIPGRSSSSVARRRSHR